MKHIATVLTFLAACASVCATAGARTTHVSISFPSSVHAAPVRGRVYVIISKTAAPDPRIQILAPEQSPPFFGKDVSGLKPGENAVVDSTTFGYPLRSLSDLPAGDYYVEAFANIFTRYHRADGHTVWAGRQWDGQVYSLSAGNLHSRIQKVYLNPAAGFSLHLTLDKEITQAELANLLGGEGYATDTPWIKHMRILSPTLTKFWGSPVYLGATVLLPKGYASHPASHYPVVYNQGHLYQPVPWDFTTDAKTETPRAHEAGKRAGYGTGYEFYQAWNSANFPRFLLVTWQHPCPYFDDSYAVNSAACGPFGDAIMNELLPAIETRFRVLRKGYARFVEGGSTGGWESLALQIQHPKYFGGAYIFDPDPVDFHAFQLVDIYNDPNAFYAPSDDPWRRVERPFSRRPNGQAIGTERQISYYEDVLGSKGRSGYQLDGWWSIFSPLGSDGYPLPLWNMYTGAIDRNVAQYMQRSGYDLVDYMRTNWHTIGPDVAGKLHFFVGDMDSYYLNLAVYKAQDFLSSVSGPAARATFAYGRPMKGHGWHPMTWAALLRQMAAEARKNAPASEDARQWNY